MDLLNIIFIGLVVYLIYTTFLQQSKQDNLSKPWHGNIEELTIKNRYYRQVLSTTSNFQLTLMSIQPGEDIGMEVHPKTTQFIRAEKGNGIAIIGDKQYQMNDGDSVVVPPNIRHNIINTSQTQPLQLYVIYTPAEHKPGTIHQTKADDDHH